MNTPIGRNHVPNDGLYADGLDARPGRRGNQITL
jgi:hypothetical protein